MKEDEGLPTGKDNLRRVYTTYRYLCKARLPQVFKPVAGHGQRTPVVAAQPLLTTDMMVSSPGGFLLLKPSSPPDSL